MTKQDPFSLTETAGEKRLSGIKQQRNLLKIEQHKRRNWIIACYAVVMMAVAVFFFLNLKEPQMLWAFVVSAICGGHMLRRTLENQRNRIKRKTKFENALWIFMLLMLLAATGWIVHTMAYVYSVLSD
ncbi:MAG: hypothetical protein Q8K65_08405 [Alphaproteobacteria bacterium]|nr:hypothetical protein [Alphaproteobacteria bacterium]